MNDLFNTVTVEQFKAYYHRDFPFLPEYQYGNVYAKNDVVYYDDNFYKSLIDDNSAAPDDIQSWKKTSGDKYSYITDDDIQKAFGQAKLNANENFGNTCADKVIIFLHLMAFYLVMDLKNSASGVNSAYSGLLSSKSVGSVSESYNFPQWLVNMPLYSIYSQNGYGMKYLSLILPYLGCTVLFSRGRTTIA